MREAIRAVLSPTFPIAARSDPYTSFAESELSFAKEARHSLWRSRPETRSAIRNKGIESLRSLESPNRTRGLYTHPRVWRIQLFQSVQFACCIGSTPDTVPHFPEEVAIASVCTPVIMVARAPSANAESHIDVGFIVSMATSASARSRGSVAVRLCAASKRHASGVHGHLEVSDAAAGG